MFCYWDGTQVKILETDTHAPSHADGGADEIVNALDVDALANALYALYDYGGWWWFISHWYPEMMETASTETGAVSWTGESALLDTGTTINSYIRVYKYITHRFNVSWDKKRRWKVWVRFRDISNAEAHVAMGQVPSTGLPNTDRHVGFKLGSDGKLYATVADGTSESTFVIETLTEDSNRALEVVFTPGVEARFYVDGVDVGALTSNLPSGDELHRNYMLAASITNLEASVKRFYLYHLRAIMEP